MHHLNTKKAMVYHMTKKERLKWKINIENSAAEVAAKTGERVVSSVFRRYDAHNLCDLNPCYYTEVFADLEQIRND